MSGIEGTLLADVIEAERYLRDAAQLRFCGLPVARMSRDELLAVVGYIWSVWPEEEKYAWREAHGDER